MRRPHNVYPRTGDGGTRVRGGVLRREYSGRRLFAYGDDEPGAPDCTVGNPTEQHPDRHRAGRAGRRGSVMPLPVQPAADSMPSGGSSDPNAVPASAALPKGGTQPTAGAGASGWMPVFQIGSGQTGVPTDARGLISGFQASGTVGSQGSR